MGWLVTVTAGNGSQHGPVELPREFMPAGEDEPTALEVAAALTAGLADEHRRFGLTAAFGFQAPLTILIEDAA